jgi:hypothetical protein
MLCKARETLNLSEKMTVAPFGMPSYLFPFVPCLYHKKLKIIISL